MPGMDRRRFLLTALAGGLARPLGVEAQQAAKVPTIGVLLTASATQTPNLNDLRRGLQEMGYVEGRSIVLDVLSADAKLERLPNLARQLAHRHVDIIVTSGPPAISAARAATATIPIVMARMDDVDVHGFVTSLARPGGNVTGLSFQTGELAGKWVGLLKDAVPHAARLALLWDVTGTAHQRVAAASAAKTLGIETRIAEVKGALGLDEAFAAAKDAQALAILASPALTAHQTRLAQLSSRHRLPAIYYNRGFVTAGGLLSYGPDPADFGWHRAAVFVDKILKGARPGDLPVEQPTKFELAINLKTAKALGLMIPPSLLARADQVVE
jgi:putative ABC transport system substrate-binding protein